MRISCRANRRWLWLLFVPLLGLSGCGKSPNGTDGSASPASPVGVGESSPKQHATTNDSIELQILDYEGIQKLLTSHRGKVVVMDAWSTSCGPCVREFPGLVALSKKYPTEKLACVSLSFDYYGGESPEELKPPILEFLTQQGANFDNILSSVPDSELYKKFQLDSVPAVFVYHTDGNLARRFDNGSDGEFTYADIEPFVAKLLGE